MNDKKTLSSRIWDRLNPFQSSTTMGTSHDAIFVRGSEPEVPRKTATLEPASGWTIVDETPTPKQTLELDNGPVTILTSFDENGPRILSRVKKTPQYKRAVRVRPAILSDDRFQVLQKWEGTVLEVEGSTFFARLKNLTSENPNEEVEIELEEVLSDDQPLVQPCASFYWSIGYLHKSHGQRIRASEIRFRRIPGWTEEEILAADKQVEIDRSFYNLDCGESSAQH